MPRAVELLKQGRNEELWQMCCGYLKFSLDEFMAVQERLLLEQIGLLGRSPLGNKIMRGSRPQTVEEFRRQVPLTTYADYCPELEEKREDVLPLKPALWVHTSGRSGEYSCKWVPMTQAYTEELSLVMYGIGMFASCKGWGDTSGLREKPKFVYTVAPRPYMSGAMASLLERQTPTHYLPPLEEAENLSFEERIKLGFKQALFHGIDYFFGLSLVLAAVGEKFSESNGNVDIRPFLSQPKALLRLTKGLVRSKVARRPMLPKDIWSVKGIMSSGLDSGVYKEKIKRLWGKYPLDVYTSTEGGIVATQTWDYDAMTFVPTLNFLEFIPEKEHFKWQFDHRYQPKTVLIDQVKADENYELVITSFHGGALTRYRIGDMIRITSLGNEKLGIKVPQMAFERRADDLLDFVVVRVTEKTLWEAIEQTGIPYADWTARKRPGEPVLELFIEIKDGYRGTEEAVAQAVYERIMSSDQDAYTASTAHDDLADMINFGVKVNLLPRGAFTGYTAKRQAEGADLAHLKPPHINPPAGVLSLLKAEAETVPEGAKAGSQAEAVTA